MHEFYQTYLIAFSRGRLNQKTTDYCSTKVPTTAHCNDNDRIRHYLAQSLGTAHGTSLNTEPESHEQIEQTILDKTPNAL